MRFGEPVVEAEAGVRERSADGEFDAFWSADHSAVLALAAALTGDWNTAEDLTQDAFAALHGRWDEVENPAAWVRRVVTNRAASHWRRRVREAAALARLAARPAAVALAPEHDEFWATVRALPRREAQVVALYYVDDRSIAQIATLLGIAEGTVKATLSHARASLARALAVEEES
ncbi:MAG TPA: sigma-70 family RNA polymerase sigma factor [Acidimicrobiia bacterium]|jgi:RNA polymerase sigma-70 factor (ECF subfamily)|nr:sigma-70 family RNA polymerase sigma factor [Acidimicrobiia bacterium]